MSQDRIYHYTSIESLALILKTGKLRFSRLDGVDDVREAQSHSGVDFGKYFFVSCWTSLAEESIPQWHIYSNGMRGVRIGFPLYPFNSIPLQAPPNWKGINIADEVISPLPFHELFGESYFIFPMFMKKEHFASQVNYVDDVHNFYLESVRRNEDYAKNLDELKILNLTGLPFTKSLDWRFQKEYRFSLFIAPAQGLRLDKEYSVEDLDAFSRYVSHAFRNNLDPGINYIDLPISLDALHDMEIRLGPLITEGDALCVDALVAKYQPCAKIEHSALKNTIRRKL